MCRKAIVMTGCALWLGASCVEVPTGGVPSDATGKLVHLTALNSPVLGLLADDRATVHGDLYASLGLDAATEAIADAHALIADGNELTPDHLRNHVLIDAALRAEVPIVLENGTAEHVAAVSGVGPDASVALISRADTELTTVNPYPRSM